MKEAHSHLNLTDEHFDVAVSHLISTLKQLNVEEKIIKQIGVSLEPLRKDIVSVKSTQPASQSISNLPSQKDISKN